MKVVQLRIKNFRGVSAATLAFSGHTLLLGDNNVGKSTVCEALDLALGLDRLKLVQIGEFDFYNARYLDKSKDPPEAIPFEIEVTITGLSAELSARCVNRTENWHSTERRLLSEGELAKVDADEVEECLRIKTIGYYDAEEDEFKSRSVFCSGPLKPDGGEADVPRVVRQLFGFVYLRALRTGSRALSLERGSLLDLILQRTATQTGIWEAAIERLRDLTPPIDEGAANLAPILENIEHRLRHYLSLAGSGRTTQLFVSQLTRDHLRKTIAFFMKAEAGQEAVPFQEMGTGTLNVLVLALLSFIAEIKKDSVVFAMEEPEIALPPHTQRRIAAYLLNSSDQCFVTSHSPYIIECFEPEHIRILRKPAAGTLEGRSLRLGKTMKVKTFRRHARRAIAEAMLSRAVVVAEGISDKEILLETARKMEHAQPKKCYPLDVSGVSIMSVDGEGSLAEFGDFFTDIGVKAYAFFDAKKGSDPASLKKHFVVAYQTKHVGAETLVTEECPVERLWAFLEEIREAGHKPGMVPATKPADAKVRELAKSILTNEKGAGHAGRIIQLCEFAELPKTAVEFLTPIYQEFPPPQAVPAYIPSQPKKEKATEAKGAAAESVKKKS